MDREHGLRSIRTWLRYLLFAALGLVVWCIVVIGLVYFFDRVVPGLPGLEDVKDPTAVAVTAVGSLVGLVAAGIAAFSAWQSRRAAQASEATADRAARAYFHAAAPVGTAEFSKNRRDVTLYFSGVTDAVDVRIKATDWQGNTVSEVLDRIPILGAPAPGTLLGGGDSGAGRATISFPTANEVLTNPQLPLGERTAHVDVTYGVFGSDYRWHLTHTSAASPGPWSAEGRGGKLELVEP